MKKYRYLCAVTALLLTFVMLFPTAAFAAEGVKPTAVTLGVGETYKLPFTAPEESVSSDPSVLTVSGKQLTGAKTGKASYSYTDAKGREYSYTVTVKPAPTSVKLNIKSKTVYTGKTFTLTYALSKGSSGAVTFKSSKSSVAYINQKGGVLALRKGKTTLTATAYNGQKASCTLTVKQKVTEITLNRERMAIPKKGTVKLKATVNKGAVSNSYKWKSSDKKIATVKGSGKTAVVTAKKPGKAKITVTADSGAKATFTAEVTKTTTSDSLRKQINSQPLHKVRTGIVAIDKKVDSIFKKIFKKNYTTYDKVKAIYDYEIKNFSYGSGTMTDKQRNALYNKKNVYPGSMADNTLASYAYETMCTKKGVCTDYAAVFTVMTRAIGLDTYSVSGDTTRADNSWTVHTWNNMLVNGRYLVFDAQVEDDIAWGGDIGYYRFGKTDKQVKNSYRYSDRGAQVAEFNCFRPLRKFTVEFQFTFNNKTVTKKRTFSWEDESREVKLKIGSYKGKISYVAKVLSGYGVYHFVSGNNNKYGWELTLTRFSGTFNTDDMCPLEIIEEQTYRYFSLTLC